MRRTKMRLKLDGWGNKMGGAARLGLFKTKAPRQAPRLGRSKAKAQALWALEGVIASLRVYHLSSSLVSPKRLAHEHKHSCLPTTTYHCLPTTTRSRHSGLESLIYHLPKDFSTARAVCHAVPSALWPARTHRWHARTAGNACSCMALQTEVFAAWCGGET